MERSAYNNFPKNRNGPGYGGQNQECRDASRRIICKLRGGRYRNPGNEWLAKFIQEELFTFVHGIVDGGVNAPAVGTSDPVLRNVNSGAFEVYDLATNQLIPDPRGSLGRVVKTKDMALLPMS
jgi:hypothetical protein